MRLRFRLSIEGTSLLPDALWRITSITSTLVIERAKPPEMTPSTTLSVLTAQFTGIRP